VSEPLTFTVYGRPQPAGSKRVVPAGGKRGGRPIVIDDAKRSRPWKQDVTAAAREAFGDRELLAGPLALELTFNVARPRGHYGARGVKPSAPAWPTVRPDVLKLTRAVEDALTGQVWRDDSQVVHETLIKRYGEPERVDVTVIELEAAGVDVVGRTVVT